MTEDLERAGRDLVAHPEAIPTSVETLEGRVRDRRHRRNWQRAGGAVVALAVVVGSVAVLRDDPEQPIVAESPEPASGPCIPPIWAVTVGSNMEGYTASNALGAPIVEPGECEIPPPLVAADFPDTAIVMVYDEGQPAVVVGLDLQIAGTIAEYPNDPEISQYEVTVADGTLEFVPRVVLPRFVEELCGDLIGMIADKAVVKGECVGGLDGVWLIDFAGGEPHLLYPTTTAPTPTRFVLVERTDSKQPEIGPGETEILYSCIAPPYSMEVFNGEALAEQGDDEAAAALRDVIASMPEIGPLPEVGWRRLYSDADVVAFGHGLPQDDSLIEVVVRREGDEWTFDGSALCGKPNAFVSGRSLVNFEVTGELFIDEQTIQVVLTERDCTSATPLDGRVDEPRVIYEADAVSVLYTAEPLEGDAFDCPGNPEYTTTLHLSEALGDRELRDLSVYPAEVEIAGTAALSG